MTNNTTPETLAQQAIERGTPVLMLDPCDKCKNEKAIYFYQRKGRTHNGCLWCHWVDGKQPIEPPAEATPSIIANCHLLTTEDGLSITKGKRACTSCGGVWRLSKGQLGKRKGACVNCARSDYYDSQQSKSLKRTEAKAKDKLHKFVVSSIERSGVVEVAPQSQTEYFEVRALMLRAQLVNEREQRLQTGVKWEIGHIYPAAGTGATDNLRGKATIDNLCLVQMGLNRAAGNGEPEQWEVRQVVNIKDCRRIITSKQAADAWKATTEKLWGKASPTERKQRTATERRKQAEHVDRVKSIVGDVVRVLDFFGTDYTSLLDLTYQTERIEAKWEKELIRMDRAVRAATETGIKIPYAEAHERVLTAQAFTGATARLQVVLMTFKQLLDALQVLESAGGELTDEQTEQIETIKRHACLWGRDVLSNRVVDVPGFTHPLLSVLGDWFVWGTQVNPQTGQQFLCSWKRTDRADELKAFDGGWLVDESKINPALLIPA